jgi:hypothetical protein
VDQDLFTGSPRRRREISGTWLPEPVMTSGGELGPLETAEQRDVVSSGVLILLEKLSPAQRAVFVLREASPGGPREVPRVSSAAPVVSRSPRTVRGPLALPAIWATPVTAGMVLAA